MVGDLDRVAVDGGLDNSWYTSKMSIRRPQEEGMAFTKYIYEIKRARGESMTSWINRSDEAPTDMRKKLATAHGANSSESRMIPPQIQGWLLLLRARLRDQDIVGVMTMTGGSLNIKLVEKSLLDLFTDDVLQSVDRSHGKDSGNTRKSTLLRQSKRFQRTMMTPISMMTSVQTMIRTSMKTETSLANEEIVSDIDDDLAIDDEEYHEVLLVWCEARDLMKEARFARGFYPGVVPIRSDKPTGRGNGEGSKGSGRSSNFRVRGKKRKAGRSGTRDGPSSSQVCFKCGSTDHWARDCPKMDDGSCNPKWRNLGAYANGAWTCSNTDSARDEKCFVRLDLCGSLVWCCDLSCPRR